jgi:hypothetical protein
VSGGWDRAPQRSGLLQLTAEMMLLPLRLFGVGVGLLARTAQGAQRLDANAPGSGRGWGGQVAPPWTAPPPVVAYFPPPTVSTTNAVTADAAGAVVDAAEPKKQEEKDMSCDKDLSGKDLKIVEYSIITVNPDIQNDDERILQGTKTIATSDDMNDTDFTAWVIALFIQRHPDRVRHQDKQYLRVCYSVQCRLTMPEVNYQKKQADALDRINATLERKLCGCHSHEHCIHDGDDGDLPAKTR